MVPVGPAVTGVKGMGVRAWVLNSTTATSEPVSARDSMNALAASRTSSMAPSSWIEPDSSNTSTTRRPQAADRSGLGLSATVTAFSIWKAADVPELHVSSARAVSVRSYSPALAGATMLNVRVCCPLVVASAWLTQTVGPPSN